MKVGTDGVLLGAWCDVTNKRRILDIGTGSGLIALMVAQRNTDAIVDAIDVDDGAVEQAQLNAQASPFAGRINVWKADFRELQLLQENADVVEEGRYDLIVSNPPFYTDETRSPEAGRSIARNASALPFESLMSGVSKLLAFDGVFSLIIPVAASQTMISLGAQYGLYLTRRTDVSDSPKAVPKRSLLSFARHVQPTVREQLVIHAEDDKYSEKMWRLTKDFYLP